jgi:hypothetical protein
MPKEPSNTKEIRSYHTVLPEVETLLSVQTVPKAVCSFFHSETEGHALRLDADDFGIVRFHARALKGWKPLEVHLEYAGENGEKIRHALTLRGDHDHDAPITVNEVGSGAKGASRPPLGANAMGLSNPELIALGYPPRPDPKLDPARYARWHRIVSRPFQAVSSRIVARPEVTFSRPARMNSPTLPLPPPRAELTNNITLQNWSGAYITNPAAQFCLIQADWNVPAVFAIPGAPVYSAASEWVGLDNGTTDLYQAGSLSECIVFPAFGWTFTNYSMWVEMLPFNQWLIPNFAVSPRDAVSVDIFLADQNGTVWFQNGRDGGLTPADNSVWFMIYNYSQGESFWGTYPATSVSLDGQTSTPFTGTTAEFIIERPSLNNSPVPLASFGIAGMQNCWYSDSFYGERPWPLGADGSTPLDGSLAYVNMQDPVTNNFLDLTFSSPDPTSPEGYQIAFLWTNYL